MKIINSYITKNLLAITAVSLAVLTFVFLSANLLKIFDLLARGFDFMTILKFLVCILPNALSLTIPFSLLISTVLFFSKISAENEVTALRAGGVSLWQIIAPGLMLSIVFSLLCFYMHMKLGPDSRYTARVLKETEKIKDPTALLEPGRFVEIGDWVISVAKINDEKLEGIHIIMTDKQGKVTDDIDARRGYLQDNDGKTMLILEDTIITSFSANETDEPARLTTKKLTFPMYSPGEGRRRRLTRKTKHMTLAMLFGRIYLNRSTGESVTPLYVELNKRMSLALSPLAFFLMGMPFGIRTKRAETSVGLLMAAGLGLGFYVFIMLADSLKHKTGLHPELLVWLPNIIYQLGGLWALRVVVRR